MEPGKQFRNLSDIGTYLKKALKFYDLKNERLTPVIFTVILFTGFSGVFIPDSINLFVYGFYNVISIAIMYLASAIYLLVYIKELKGEEYSFNDCLKRVFYNVAKIVLASIMYMAVTLTGFFLLFVPGIVLSLMFLFNTCYIVDKNNGIVEAFNASKRLTDGRKLEVFGIVAVFYILVILPFSMFVMIAASSNNNIIFAFVLSFAATIINLMHQRLTALIYIDLEYGEAARNR